MQTTEEKDALAKGWIKSYDMQEGIAEKEQWREE